MISGSKITPESSSTTRTLDETPTCRHSRLIALLHNTGVGSSPSPAKEAKNSSLN